MIKVYISANFSNKAMDRIPKLANALEEKGFEIGFKWWELPADLIDIELYGEIRRLRFKAIEKADWVILDDFFSTDSEIIDYGYALDKNKKIIYYGFNLREDIKNPNIIEIKPLTPVDPPVEYLIEKIMQYKKEVENTLRDYSTDYPNYYEYNQVELGVQEVFVADIIGGNPFASKNYQCDWIPKPIEFDFRYEGVEKFVKARLSESKSEVLDLGYIHLFRFYNRELDKPVYYVCMDGHRRISICHKLEIKKILAKITEIVN